MEALKKEEAEALVLASNVREECDLIQNELETLTQVGDCTTVWWRLTRAHQVLFEEVNALVSSEGCVRCMWYSALLVTDACHAARASHEEKQRVRELTTEVKRLAMSQACLTCAQHRWNGCGPRYAISIASSA